MVLDHVPHAQILDGDHLVFAHQSSTELVQVIPPTVRNPCMDTGNFAACLVSVLCPLFLLGELALRSRHFLPILLLVSGVGDLLPGGEGVEGGDTRVDTNGGLCRWVRGDRVVYQDRDMVAARRVPGHGHTRRVRPFWQWARPSDIEWLRLLRQLDLSIAVGEAVAEVRCRVPGFPLLLEL